jgi:hypothetical protein
MYLIVFDVLVDGTSIHIDDPRRARHSDDLHILVTARAPNLFTEN